MQQRSRQFFVRNGDSSKSVRFATILFFFVFLIAWDLPAADIDGNNAQLGPAPELYGHPSDFSEPLLQEEPVSAMVTGPKVNPRYRAKSLAFYKDFYLGSAGADIGWTGIHELCKAGTTDYAFRSAILKRIRYFRAMAGVPTSLSLLSGYNRKDQKAALMMSVNRSLSHSPPTNWQCYTPDGATAAGNSNLALGVYGSDAISLYMRDPGTGNGFVGHRRWILYPQTQLMGTGDVPDGTGVSNANALWVIDSHTWDPRPPTRDGFVAWPPPGYVPYQVIFARWSFSYPDADFSLAQVTMTQRGKSVPVQLEMIVNGYGENTLVWIPNNMQDWDVWAKPSRDKPYIVTVSNVIVGGTSRDFQYKVIVFDPD